LAIGEDLIIMRFHQRNELETLFNVQKCAHHGAPLLAYFQEWGHKRCVFWCPSYETCSTSVEIDHQYFNSTSLIWILPSTKQITLKVWQLKEIDF